MLRPFACTYGEPANDTFSLCFLQRFESRGSPSVACPLSGRKVHWTFLFFRLALSTPPSGLAPRCRRGSQVALQLTSVPLSR